MSAQLTKGQFHHYIPRFILRRYLPTAVQAKSERQKQIRKAPKTEKVLVYHISSQTLKLRPLGKIYGEIDLYKDGRNPTNALSLETKFSGLESEASEIINNVHASIAKKLNFKLKRKGLEILRKFLFLQRLRNAALAATYYNEDCPHNAQLVAWIKKFKAAKGLETHLDVWLHAMKYYLATPHHAIVAEGEAIKKKYGVSNMTEMMRSKIDPNIGNWLAVDYETIANVYFLGVLEAADGEEFIISDNSFGLCEGYPDLHRLFVVSPQAIIVLRSNFTRIPGLSRQLPMRSTLLSIPMEIAQHSLANKNLFAGASSQEQAARIMTEYRTTPKAKEDTFNFKITKLTPEQTYLVNEVILLNGRKENGLLTFSSKDKMLSTVHRYFHSNNLLVKQDRVRYRALLKLLSETATMA